MITYDCVCGKRFHVADEKAGHRVRCPACGAVGRVGGAPVSAQAGGQDAIPVLQAVPESPPMARRAVPAAEAEAEGSWLRENIFNLFGMGVVVATLLILGVFLAIRGWRPAPSETASEPAPPAQAAPATATAATPAKPPAGREAPKPAPRTDSPARVTPEKAAPKPPKPKPDWTFQAFEAATPKAEPKPGDPKLSPEAPVVATPELPAPKKAGPPSAQELSAAALFKAASPAVVRVDVSNAGGQAVSQGSGFLVSPDGYVVTNFHVIRDGHSATVLLASELKCIVEGVAALDRGADLALLKVRGTNLPSLEVAAQQLPEIGAKVYAIGSPRGLTNTLSEGLVSGHREPRPGLKIVQTSAAISPGSSGGPLLAADGKVVGVTSSQVATGQNLNFAIPAERVAKLIAARGAVPPMSAVAELAKPTFGPSPTEKDPLGLVGTWVEDWPGVGVHDVSLVTYWQGQYKVQVLNPQTGPYDVDNVRIDGNVLKFTEYAGTTPIDYEVRVQNANTCAVTAQGGPSNGAGIVWRRDTSVAPGQVGPRPVPGGGDDLVATLKWETVGTDVDLAVVGPQSQIYKALTDVTRGPGEEACVVGHPAAGAYKVAVAYASSNGGQPTSVVVEVRLGGRSLGTYQAVLRREGETQVVTTVTVGAGSNTPAPQPSAPLPPGERDPAGFAGTWVEYWPGVGVHDINVVTYNHGQYHVQVTSPNAGPVRVANVRRLGRTLRFTEFPGNNVIEYEATVQDANTLSVRARGGPPNGDAVVWRRQ